MKKCRLILIGTLITAALMAQILSCSKHQTVMDNGCIDRVIPGSGQTLPAIQLDSIDALFSNNNLSTANLQFDKYYVDDHQVPGVHRQLVTAIIFFNGLPLFDFDDFFEFDDGIMTDSQLYSGSPSLNDTSSHQTLSFLRSAFIKYAVQSSPDQFANTCLSATLGYLDHAEIPKNVLPFGTPIKVWRITPANADYPTVYVKDDDSTAWGPPILPID
jgi:hypothetical protein